MHKCIIKSNLRRGIGNGNGRGIPRVVAIVRVPKARGRQVEAVHVFKIEVEIHIREVHNVHIRVCIDIVVAWITIVWIIAREERWEPGTCY